MASRTATVIGRAIQRVADADSVSDRELLRRFAAEHDQAAFAALVGRHAGMVLGVCRRALPTLQDAEDACQAAFLLLARKAKGNHWHSSVANWLHSTARKVAGNARVAARRREIRERRAAVAEVVRPVDRMTGRELLQALDEELERLPPVYREPLVLCYLEGLTRDEAAARLGVVAGTLKNRLVGARKRLGAALMKRGVVLGVGLLAFTATSPAEASPPRLVQAIMAAASGTVPDAVAALANGVAVNGIINRSLLALAATVVAVALGFGLGSVRTDASGQPAVPPRQEKPPETPRAATISGRVLGPDAKPCAEAKLLILGPGDRLKELGGSGRDGRFTVTLPTDWEGGSLVARADGFGLDFVNLTRIDLKAEVELRLPADHPIRGRVLDTEGKPVSGADVRVDRLGAFPDNSLDQFLADWKAGHLPAGLAPGGAKNLPGGVGKLFSAATDKDGRFEFRGVGAERLATLRLTKPRFTEHELFVVNRKDFNPRPYNEALADVPKVFGAFTGRLLLDGPDLTVITEREMPIRGRVTDAKTGAARPKVHVILSRNGGKLLPVPLGAWTDAEGRYEIHGARKAKSYVVEVPADPDSGHMPAQARADDDTPGYEPITIDLRVKTGVVITGKITDKATGKPVPGFVMAAVLVDNRFADDYPEFQASAWFPIVGTAADGSFRVVTVPGPVVLMAGPESAEVMAKYKRSVPDPNYPRYFKTEDGHTSFTGFGGLRMPLQGNFLKVLDIKPGTKTLTEDAVFEPAK